MKVAAYQAPLVGSGSLEAVDLIRTKVEWCESHGVVILCCPEAILGGLADYAADPREFAIDARGDQLARALAPLASDTVTTIVGFTELTGTRTAVQQRRGLSQRISHRPVPQATSRDQPVDL